MTFKEIKDKLDLTDVAERLGYKIDKSKGTNTKWVTFNLGDPKAPMDTIMISTPYEGSPSDHRYFRHGYARSSDVIDFVRENLAQLGGNPALKDDAKHVWHIMMYLINGYSVKPIETPQVEKKEKKVFNIKDYDVNYYDPTTMAYALREGIFSPQGKLEYFFRRRAINDDTVINMAHMICTIRLKDRKFFNVGFPYISPETGEILGFELRGPKSERGKTFRGFTTGSNKSQSLWIADFSGMPRDAITHVLFFESALDAIAFSQARRSRIDYSKTVLVASGGGLSNDQLLLAKLTYPNAVLVDSFDNDLVGRLYGIKMSLIGEDKMSSVKNFVKDKETGIYHIILEDKDFDMKEEDLTLENLFKKAGWHRIKTMSQKAPLPYKDWNDVLMASVTKSPMCYGPTKTEWRKEVTK